MNIIYICVLLLRGFFDQLKQKKLLELIYCVDILLGILSETKIFSRAFPLRNKSKKRSFSGHQLVQLPNCPCSFFTYTFLTFMKFHWYIFRTSQVFVFFGPLSNYLWKKMYPSNLHCVGVCHNFQPGSCCEGAKNYYYNANRVKLPKPQPSNLI